MIRERRTASFLSDIENSTTRSRIARLARELVEESEFAGRPDVLRDAIKEIGDWFVEHGYAEHVGVVVGVDRDTGRGQITIRIRFSDQRDPALIRFNTTRQ